MPSHSNAFTLQGLQRRLANARTVSEHSGDDEYRAISMSNQTQSGAIRRNLTVSEHSGDDEYRAISMSNADRARSSSRRNESVFSRFALRRVPWSGGRE